MSPWSKYLFVPLAILLFQSLAVGQNKADLERKRNEISKKIQYTNRLISNTKKSQRLTQTQLVILNKQISLREELIATYQYELQKLNQEISENQAIVESMEEDIKQLKKEYAAMIYYAYKNRSAYDRVMFLFASESFNQAFKRLKYLQQYSAYRKRQADIIRKTQEVLEEKIQQLEEKKNEKQTVLEAKGSEVKELSEDKSEQQTSLKKLQQEEKKLKKQLRQQERDKKRLNDAIKRIIEEEIRRAKEKNKGSFVLTPEAKILSDNFEKNKGKLPWPVERGVITGKYGKFKHPVLRGIEINNNGIDITTSKGSEVRCVFKGEVSAVITIPGAGKAVIVSHGAFRTVYSNLQEVYVEKGDELEVKQALGRVLTDGTKTEAHFEVWKISGSGTQKQNPEYWIYSN